MKIAIIIFTRNELKNSEIMFPKLPKKVVDNVYVIDGNSTDGTKEYYGKQKIKVFGQKYSRVGGAYESAFRNTTEDALIFFHPDGNMDPQEIKKFVKLLKQGEQFIIASRVIKGAYNEEDNQLFKPRKWFNLSLALIANTIWGNKNNKGSDITQGYRALTRSTFKKMNIKIPSPIAPDFEQVIRALKHSIKITEFPTHEGDRIYGSTSITSLKAGIEHLKLLFRELLLP